MSSKHYRQFNNLPEESKIEEVVIPINIEPVKKEEMVGAFREALEVPVKLTHDELHEALLWIQDMLDRSSVLFMVGGEVGKQIKETDLPQLDADRLEIIVLKQHFTDSGRSMLKSLLEQYYIKDIDWTEDSIKFSHRNVPIIITIVHNMYPFFLNPDFAYYTVTEFKIPNPFNAYWEERDHIA
jgi:hypothetical protein